MAVRFSEEEYNALVGDKKSRTRQNKYLNVRVELDGITFDSERERDRYAELKVMEKSRLIKDLTLQPVFELVPAIRENGKIVQRAVTYKADFSYTYNGSLVVEDAKGVKTDVYKLKKKIMRYVHGIEVREV